MTSIREKVFELIYDVCSPERPDLGDTNRSLLSSGFDSLDYATLLMSIEEYFGLTISDSDLGRVISIDDLVRFVEEKTSLEESRVQ